MKLYRFAPVFFPPFIFPITAHAGNLITDSTFWKESTPVFMVEHFKEPRVEDLSIKDGHITAKEYGPYAQSLWMAHSWTIDSTKYVPMKGTRWMTQAAVKMADTTGDTFNGVGLGFGLAFITGGNRAATLLKSAQKGCDDTKFNQAEIKSPNALSIAVDNCEVVVKNAQPTKAGSSVNITINAIFHQYDSLTNGYKIGQAVSDGTFIDTRQRHEVTWAIGVSWDYR